MDNPLLQFDTLPDFRAIQPGHVTPAIDRLLADADAALERTVGPTVAPDYDAMSAVLDVATERLSRAWGVVSHLNSVADTPELRAAYNDNLPKVTAFHTKLGADERLYAKYKAVAASPAAAALNAARRKSLDNALRDFVLSGAELQGAARLRFAQIQERLAELSQKFSEHVLDATDGFVHYAATDELAGVPDDVRQATREAARAEGREGHRLTLHQPVYIPVLQYATNRRLRETLYRAYVTRASELGPAEQDNGPLMRELLELRQEAAALLGHTTYADMSLVPKMARDPAEVRTFLHDLAQRAKPFAERDMAELRAFAAAELNLPQLEAWDIPFASERLKEQRYAFSELEVKRYFTEPKVLQGLFEIVQTIFEVQISPDSAPVWHDSVRFFRVERDGRLLAQFYLDAYARPGKQPGAWMDVQRARWARPDAGGNVQTPVATLQCNYAPPVGREPALLTHDDVITLFHEFGHGLHLMLTRVDDIGVSGLSGVEWDAVELPSQFMENFCWEWDVLRGMTAHAETGAPLPRALFDKMLAARNFQSGMAMVRQLELSLFDMRIHDELDAKAQVQRVLDEVRAQVAVVQAPAFNRFAQSFSHIFGGGYAAGYYSYKWAEVLSADAWSAFEEAGALSVATGRRLREEVLEAGGSRSAMENFVAFRGREPRIDALLRHQGMA
ncbi:MAG TPA: M3 family metallopeptidase [Burkholderiaceae bacterium]|nr:M3 family metallopeptidase [Burkholderiaceae bacterium]